MKLYGVSTSPFLRKVRACAITRDIDGQIERIAVDGNASPPMLTALNPLSKIPVLVTQDGFALYDSPVICEFLDTVGDAPAMFPPAGRARWVALRLQALGDGMMDAAVLRRGETGRPREEARDRVIARQQAAVTRSLAELEREPPHRLVDVGSLAVACALGYLDFRYAHEPWREAHPQLAAWYAEMSALPALTQSQPEETPR